VTAHAVHADEYEQAASLSSEAMTLFRALGASDRAAEVLWSLAVTAQIQGPHEEHPARPGARSIGRITDAFQSYGGGGTSPAIPYGEDVSGIEHPATIG
jgi:glutamate mutase epsilon subunit